MHVNCMIFFTTLSPAKAIFNSAKIFKSAKDSYENNNLYTVAQLDEPFDIMVIPMASMGGKLKGSSVQYHSNVSRDEGKELYDLFVNECKKNAGSKNKVVSGTYGNRQSLKFDAELGPFAHLLEF
jgi:D-tyrosyl-tRNA(Tyr) deacylase